VKLNKILFATDYSPASNYALRFASSLARDTQATLLIVHVSNTEPYPVGEIVNEPPRPAPDDLKQLLQLVPEDPQIHVEHQLLYAKPPGEAEAILTFAAQSNVDAIVAGTHGRTGLRRILAGSIAEALMRDATCPVITIRQPATSPPDAI
jgi:universal stress protein A